MWSNKKEGAVAEGQGRKIACFCRSTISNVPLSSSSSPFSFICTTHTLKSPTSISASCSRAHGRRAPLSFQVPAPHAHTSLADHLDFNSTDPCLFLSLSSLQQLHASVLDFDFDILLQPPHCRRQKRCIFVSHKTVFPSFCRRRASISYLHDTGTGLDSTERLSFLDLSPHCIANVTPHHILFPNTTTTTSFQSGSRNHHGGRDQQAAASAQRARATGIDQDGAGKRQMRRVWCAEPRYVPYNVIRYQTVILDLVSVICHGMLCYV